MKDEGDVCMHLEGVSEDSVVVKLVMLHGCGLSCSMTVGVDVCYYNFSPVWHINSETLGDWIFYFEVHLHVHEQCS